MKRSLSVLAALLPAVLFAENLFYNSSFELGANGWTDGTVNYKYLLDPKAPPLRAIDSTDAVHGGKSLRITTNKSYYPNGSWLVCSPDVKLEPGKKYTVSFYAKGAKPGTFSTLVRSNHLEYWATAAKNRTFRLTPEWKRYSFSFVHQPKGVYASRPGFDHYFLLFMFSDKENEIHFDALQMEEGELTDYKPASDVEYMVRLPTEYLRDAADRIQVDVTARFYGPAHASKHKLLLIDSWTGKTLQSKEISFDLKEGGEQTCQAEFTGIPFGGFQVRLDDVSSRIGADFVRVVSNNKVLQKNTFTLGLGTYSALGTAWKNGQAKGVEDIACVNPSYSEDDGELVRLAGSLVAKDFSGLNGSLFMIEPEKRGKFDWTYMDKYIQRCRELKLKAIMGIAAQTLMTYNKKDTGFFVPQWLRQLDTTGHPEGQCHGVWHHIKVVLPPPEVIGEAAGAIAERYGDDIYIFRLFPEVNGYMTLKQLCSGYAQSFYENVKKANPKILVNTLGPTEDKGAVMGGYFKEFLELGGEKYSDLYSFHPYSATQDDSPVSAMERIDSFRQQMKKRPEAERPLAELECFFLHPNPPNAMNSMEKEIFPPENIARRILVDMGEGLLASTPLALVHLHKTCLLHETMSRKWFRMVPDARFAVHSAMGRFLNGAVKPARVQFPGKELCYVFENHSRPYSTIWNIGGKSQMTLKLPEGVSCKVYDMFGNEAMSVKDTLTLMLDRVPVILEWSEGADPAAIHKAGSYVPQEFAEVYGVKQMKDGAGVLLSNRTGKPLSGFLRIESDYCSPVKTSFVDLKPYENTIVTLPTVIREDAPARFPVTVVAVAEGRVLTFDCELRKVPVLKVGEKPQEVSIGQHAMTLQRQGDELKFKFRLIRPEVTMPKDEKTPWTGDSVELFFDLAPELYNPKEPERYTPQCVQFIIPAVRAGNVTPVENNNHSGLKLRDVRADLQSGFAEVTASVPLSEKMRFTVQLNVGGKTTVYSGSANFRNRGGFVILDPEAK